MKETVYLHGHDYLVERVRNLSFLKSINETYIREILKLSRVRKYTPGEAIIIEGEKDSWIYIMISGAVEVLKNNHVIATFEKTGDTFGELNFIDGEPRAATVRATSGTLCLAIDVAKMSYTDMAGCMFIFYQIFSEILAARLRNTNAELIKVKKELSSIQEKKEAILSKEDPDKKFDKHLL